MVNREEALQDTFANGTDDDVNLDLEEEREEGKTDAMLQLIKALEAMAEFLELRQVTPERKE